MKNIAIITARGGSKRIPRKNIKKFCGKPIIAYSIEAATQAGCFDEIMVSTDDEEIAEIAIQYGAKVPFLRSKENSDDFSTTTDVIFEVIKEYEKKGITIEKACCIYPTAPFISGEKLKSAMNKLTTEEIDTVIPVVAFGYPPQRAMAIEEGQLVFLKPEYLRSRSQDLQKHYHDVGQFYCFKVNEFKKNKNLMVGKIAPIELTELEIQDIDTEIDWKIAELKYKLLNQLD